MWSPRRPVTNSNNITPISTPRRSLPPSSRPLFRSSPRQRNTNMLQPTPPQQQHRSTPKKREVRYITPPTPRLMSAHKKYTEYYTNEKMIKKVKRKYRKDIKLLGYKFKIGGNLDGFKPESYHDGKPAQQLNYGHV